MQYVINFFNVQFNTKKFITKIPIGNCNIKQQYKYTRSKFWDIHKHLLCNIYVFNVIIKITNSASLYLLILKNYKHKAVHSSFVSCTAHNVAIFEENDKQEKLQFSNQQKHALYTGIQQIVIFMYILKFVFTNIQRNIFCRF